MGIKKAPEKSEAFQFESVEFILEHNLYSLHLLTAPFR